MCGREKLGNGMGDKGIRNGGWQPALVIFIPLPYIPLPLLRAPGRRLSKLDLSRLYAPHKDASRCESVGDNTSVERQ